MLEEKQLVRLRTFLFNMVSFYAAILFFDKELHNITDKKRTKSGLIFP
jgi:hypothetical protein